MRHLEKYLHEICRDGAQVQNQATQAQTQATQAPSDKELNFRKQEEMFKRQLEQERQARIAAEEKVSQYAQERLKGQNAVDDEDDGDDDQQFHQREAVGLN